MQNTIDRIHLFTQGSQGIVILRELFALGYGLDQIQIFTDSRKQNEMFVEFLNYLHKDFSVVNYAHDVDSQLKASSISENDVLISVSWRYKFSKVVLSLFNGRTINFHPGLLPQYRGSYSIPWSIINNEEFVGYTYHIIDEKIDQGNILISEKISIEPTSTAHSLHFQIFQKGLAQIGKCLSLLSGGGYKQTKGGKFYANQLPFSGQIDENWPDDLKNRFIRAMHFPPFDPAFTLIDGKKKWHKFSR